MGIVDIIWMLLILGGAGYLFYRSFWKKKNPCGCEGGSCCKK
jgi:hypothetical protein